MNEVVASAIASFNNAALMPPGFLWSALLMAPVFLAVAKVAPDLLGYFFEVKKTRDGCFAWWAEVLLILWLTVGHGNWGAIRDGSGFLPYLNAAALFMLCFDAAARLAVFGVRVPAWLARPFCGRAGKWLKIGIILALAAVVAESTARQFALAAMQACAVLFGFAAGYFGRRPRNPAIWTTIIMFMVTAGILTQPEYFRFGQLGRLTMAHLAAVAGIALLAALTLVFRYAGPGGFVRDNHYKYMKWFMRLSALLMLILFIMTESVPVMIAFFAAAAALAWLAAKHSPRGTNVSVLTGNLWALTLGLFGAMTGMPMITILGILCWKNNGTRAFWRSLRAVLK